MSMSITSLTSSQEKSSRRVRFSLPEAKLTLTTDKRTLHGTTKYVNGTLINVTSTIHELGKSNSKNEINGAFKSSLKSNGNSIPSKETSQCKVSLNIHRPSSVANIKEQQGRNSLPVTTSAVVGRRKTTKTITRKSFNTLPIIERKSSSLEDFDEDSLEDESAHDAKLKTTNLTRYKSTDDLRDPNIFKVKSSVFKLPEAQNGTNCVQKKPQTSNTLKVPDNDTLSKIYVLFCQTSLQQKVILLFCLLAPSFQSCETNRKLKIDAVASDKTDDRISVKQIDSSGNLEQFFDFVDKWRANRLAGNKKIDDIFRNSSCKLKFFESNSFQNEKLFLIIFVIFPSLNKLSSLKLFEKLFHKFSKFSVELLQKIIEVKSFLKRFEKLFEKV